MTIIQYLEMFSNDSANPCYYTDSASKELVFMNQAMQKKFQVFDSYVGKKCCELLPAAGEECIFCHDSQVNSMGFCEKVVYSETLHSYVRANSTEVELMGRKLVMTKLFLTTGGATFMEQRQSFDKTISQCLEILALPDLNRSIDEFLALLGQFYHCEHTYIYEFTDGVLENRYYWNRETWNTIAPDHRSTVSIEAFVDWLENDKDKKIVNLDSRHFQYEEHSTEHQILGKYKLKNITLSKLWNKDGTLMGIVGLSNSEKQFFDDRLLKAISSFVVERFNEDSLVKALESLNEIDVLTGFYNRTKYAEKLTDLSKSPPITLGVIFVNLNGLRKTNEYLGFDMGDIQIKQTASLVKEYFSEDFYRISGDDFVGFMEGVPRETFDEKMNLLQEKLKSNNHEATFSVGHCWGAGHYVVTDLVKTADTAMTINKQAYYFNSLKNNEEITNAILSDLFEAIAEEEFLVYLQPQIDLQTQAVVSAEALVRRFDKKKQKMVFPDNFIPLYENNAIIRHVDLFMVRKVCEIQVEWLKCKQELPISVNLSRVTLKEFGIVQTISDILNEYEVPHHLVVIEVTERIGMIENDVAMTLVDEFKAEGFKLSLDDFGCAYSNIVTLAQVSVDEVKIDKSLVDNLISNPKNQIIVKNMLLMCNELENTTTLAEGIETEEQAEYLRSIHCKLGQGYLYSRPIPNEEFYEKYIKILDKSN